MGKTIGAGKIGKVKMVKNSHTGAKVSQLGFEINMPSRTDALVGRVQDHTQRQ